MQINSLSTYTYNTYCPQPGFKSWYREVSAAADKGKDAVKHRNTTYFFRNKKSWENFVSYFNKKYENVNKVNVYDYGCSNGSEAYTFIMALLTHLDKKVVKKFFPIMAKDYDEFAIKAAKSGVIPIDWEEVYNINNNTNVSFTEFFGDFCSNDIPLAYLNPQDVEAYYNFYYKIKDPLKNNVIFDVADIKTDYKNIKPDNSIVFARNFWPYMTEKEISELAENLYKTMGENSCLVIGTFDIQEANIIRVLTKAGFKRTSDLFIFEK